VLDGVGIENGFEVARNLTVKIVGDSADLERAIHRHGLPDGDVVTARIEFLKSRSFRRHTVRARLNSFEDVCSSAGGGGFKGDPGAFVGQLDGGVRYSSSRRLRYDANGARGGAMPAQCD